VWRMGERQGGARLPARSLWSAIRDAQGS
jgi:hypothetical protein